MSPKADSARSRIGPWVRCPTCRKVVRGRVPKGGDGTGLRPVWHKMASALLGRSYPCDGRFETVDVGESSGMKGRVL